MKRFGDNVEAEIASIEDSLLRLTEGFARYKSQLARAYEETQALLTRAALGFSSPRKAALHEEELHRAVQDYFRLRDQIGWWLEQAQLLAAALKEIELRETAMGAPAPGLDRQGARPCGVEEGPGTLFIELDEVF